MIYLHAVTSSGAETLSAQLAGTPVERAGPRGLVSAAFVSTLTTTTATLKGRKSGKVIIPEGSHASVTGALTALSVKTTDFLYRGQVNSEEELDLEIVVAAAGTHIVGISIE